MLAGVGQTVAGRLRAVVRRIASDTTTRDGLIVAMRDEGATLAAIAQEAGLSIEGVRKVLHRQGRR